MTVQSLTVLFDDRCGVCSRAHQWLRGQATWVPLEFVGAWSDEARRRFPGLERQQLLAELHVVDDAGRVYRGAKAWIMCLWATRAHRVLSHRLARKGNERRLRGLVAAISGRRHGLSRLLGAYRQDDAAPACDARNLP